MKKIFIVLFTVVLLTLVTGCSDDKEVSVDDQNYSIDVYKMTLDELKSDDLRGKKDLIILANKYSDRFEEIKKQAKEEVEKNKSIYEMYGYDFNEILKQYNYNSIDDYYNAVFLQFMLDIATEEYAKTLITEDEINDFYNEEVFGKVSVRHILISPSVTVDSTYEEETAAYETALKIATEVITRLKNGEEWDNISKEYSNGESIIAEELNFEYGDLPEEFEEATKKLKDGEYTTIPVETDFGYHVIYKVSEENNKSLNEIREYIINELISEKISSDDKLQVTVLENIREETYNYLEKNQIEEMFIDTETYLIYDIEGNSIYGKCQNENCTKKENIKLDLKNINTIEFK